MGRRRITGIKGNKAMDDQAFVIRDIRIRYFIDHKNERCAWVERDDGEGFGTSIDKLYKLLDEFFIREM